MTTRETATVSALKRKLNRMPAEVRAALQSRHLLGACQARPACQRRSDSRNVVPSLLGMASLLRRYDATEKRKRRAELGTTTIPAGFPRGKRLHMLDELERGDVYMNMTWRPR
jgi:hypothetical protein